MMGQIRFARDTPSARDTLRYRYASLEIDLAVNVVGGAC